MFCVKGVLLRDEPAENLQCLHLMALIGIIYCSIGQLFFGPDSVTVHYPSDTKHQMDKIATSCWTRWSIKLLKRQTFPSGVGGDQTRARQRVNIKQVFQKYNSL